ncbi:MAG: hypothetical protein M0Z30_02525 [Actinomycetota bacterium]|nr:hypothetical protein [Actinomycetota bacterium]
MAEVVVGQCHGGWVPSRDGFATVPSGVKVFLYMDSLRTMSAYDADRAALASAEFLRGIQDKASQTHEAGISFANYSTTDLSPDDVVWQGPVQEGVEIVRGGQTIQQIMDDHPNSNIYWFACQALVMKSQVSKDERPEDLGSQQLNTMQLREDLFEEKSDGGAEAEDQASETEDEQETEGGGPELFQLTRAQIQGDVVDNWNQRILKDLAEGASKTFYQLDDLVLIDLDDAGAGQPYVNWIQAQPSVAKGTVTMTAKGGAFSAGAVTVQGASNEGAFTAAVNRVSKKKVSFS